MTDVEAAHEKQKQLADLVARLRGWNNPDCKEAAAAIEELMAALRPFVNNAPRGEEETGEKWEVTWGDLRRARRAVGWKVDE